MYIFATYLYSFILISQRYSESAWVLSISVYTHIHYTVLLAECMCCMSGCVYVPTGYRCLNYFLALDLGAWSCGIFSSIRLLGSAVPKMLLYTIIMNKERILAKSIWGYFRTLGDFRYIILSLENEENITWEVNILKQRKEGEIWNVIF